MSTDSRGWVQLEDPTRYVGVNAAWDRVGDLALMADVAARATVIGGVEMRQGNGVPLDLAAALVSPLAAKSFVPSGWDVAQDTRSGAQSGSAIAVLPGHHVRLRRVTTWLASRAGHARTSVQARYLKVGHLVDHSVRTRVGVVHFPLTSTGQQKHARRAVRRFVRRCERQGVRWMLIGDFNTDVDTLARYLGARWHYSRDVMGIIVGHSDAAAARGKGWGRMAGAHRRHPATDHAILTATETHRRLPPGRVRETATGAA